jgi:hypothetical protein
MEAAACPVSSKAGSMLDGRELGREPAPVDLSFEPREPTFTPPSVLEEFVLSCGVSCPLARAKQPPIQILELRPSASRLDQPKKESEGSML